MADRVEVAKVVAYAMTGQTNAVKVTKVVAYLVLEPGESGEAPPTQGHVHTQIFRRD